MTAPRRPSCVGRGVKNERCPHREYSLRAGSRLDGAVVARGGERQRGRINPGGLGPQALDRNGDMASCVHFPLRGRFHWPQENLCLYPSVRRVLWSLFYLLVGVSFAGVIWWQMDGEKAALYLSGYALEKTLAIDNLFVFLAIFQYFGISEKEHYKIQHRVPPLGGHRCRGLPVHLLNVYWTPDQPPGTGRDRDGDPGAPGGGFMALGMCKKAFKPGGESENTDFDANVAVRLARRLFPVKADLAGGRFFVRAGGRALYHHTIPGGRVRRVVRYHVRLGQHAGRRRRDRGTRSSCTRRR